MPIFQTTLFFRLHENGWTETYFRQAEDARLASDLGPVDFFLSPRAAGVELQAVRAQELDGLRRIYLRLVQQQQPFDLDKSPDITPTCARITFQQAHGRKELFLRGLQDRDVRRRADSGRADPTARLQQQLRALLGHIYSLGLQTRQLRDRTLNPFLTVVRVDPHENPLWTRILLREPVPRGSLIYFTSDIRHIKRERPYLVTESNGTEISVLLDWPSPLAGFVPYRASKCRLLEYDYFNLADGRFSGFTKYQTGAAYFPASWHPERPFSSPLNPCGRYVDMLQGDQLYRVGMRLDPSDPTATTLVRWYFPNEEPWLKKYFPHHRREAIPYIHPFGSRVWMIGQDYPLLLGEVLLPRQKVRNVDPVELRGVGLCGSIGQWAAGVAPSDPVRAMNIYTENPCCCGEGIAQDRAGVAISVDLDGGELESALVIGEKRPALGGPAITVDLLDPILEVSLSIGGARPTLPALMLSAELLEPFEDFDLACLGACEDEKIAEWESLGKPARWQPINCTMPTPSQGQPGNPILMRVPDLWARPTSGIVSAPYIFVLPPASQTVTVRVDYHELIEVQSWISTCENVSGIQQHSGNPFVQFSRSYIKAPGRFLALQFTSNTFGQPVTVTVS